jgi:protein ImuB
MPGQHVQAVARSRGSFQGSTPIEQRGGGSCATGEPPLHPPATAVTAQFTPILAFASVGPVWRNYSNDVLLREFGLEFARVVNFVSDEPRRDLVEEASRKNLFQKTNSDVIGCRHKVAVNSQVITYYCCIYTPDLPVQAVVRERSDLCYLKDAIAVLDGPDSLQKVLSCNKRARETGLQAGMTKNQAKSWDTVLIKRSIHQEEAIHSAIMGCGFSISPFLESTCPGTVIIAIPRSERLLGSALQIGQLLLARAAECGIKAHVAFATNPDTALYAARGLSDITVIEPGQEALRISPLPIEVLQLDSETAATLDNWGIRDFHALSKVPVLALVERLGQRGLYLQQLAQAKLNRPLIVTEPTACFQESIELDDGLELLESLMFLLNRLLQQLILRLKIRSLATDQIQINMELETRPDRQSRIQRALAAPAALFQKTVKLPVPTQDANILLKLLQLQLVEDPPKAPVKKLMVEAYPAAIRFAQSGFFRPRALEPAKLEVTIGRVRAVAGKQDEAGNNLVGFPRVIDSHKPDSSEVLLESWNVKNKRERRRCVPKMPLRAFRPPVRAKVEIRDNVPSAILIHGRRRTVSRASGPWYTNGGWWDQADEWDRSEWDIQVSVHGRYGFYRIFHDHQSEQWLVEGIYD